MSTPKNPHAGKGLLALSEAADDAKYGFRSTVHPAPFAPLIMRLGDKEGLAGALRLAEAAANAEKFWNEWCPKYPRAK